MGKKFLPESIRLLSESSKLLVKHYGAFGRLVLLHVALIVLLALNPSSETGGLMTSLLMLIFSMAEIWLIRHVLAKERTNIKDALYKGTAQVIPFTLVTLLISLQLIPLAAGSWLFSTAITTGIATTLFEQAIFLLILILTTVLSFYWLTASLLALYIVTLPDLTPMIAWQTAKKLAKGRKVAISGHIIDLLLLLSLIGLGILSLVPAEWTFEYNVVALLMAVFAPFTHIYLYKLYRSLV